MPRDPTGGPYLMAAFFCEKVLIEQDGTVSFIRVIDKFSISGQSEQMPLTILRFHIVVMVKSGAFRGLGNFTITPFTPAGSQMTSIPLRAQLEGDDDKYAAVVGAIEFPVQEPGPYWFDVCLNGQMLTNTAIRVMYQPIFMQRPAPG